MSIAVVKQPYDYSLVGRDSARAVKLGLADAKWYASPVPREKMRELLERRDGPALRNALLWFGLLFAFGIAGYLLWGTWWAIIPFALYGVLYGSTADARWHEYGHGTAFKTDWINNVLYEIASFMIMRESVLWRWSHARHHSDTLIVGRDREFVVTRPVNLANTLLKFVGVENLVKHFQRMALHSVGRVSPEEKTYIPAGEYGGLFWRARVCLLIYAGALGLALYSGSILPLMYIGLPNIYGAWLVVVYGLTQHSGLAENVLDHRLNTRTVYMNRVNRFLYMNMNYHLEHHMFPLVPFHALPRLHELIKADCPQPYNGLLEAYREVVPALLRQSRDATYFVRRELPPPSPRARQANPAITAESRAAVDGWLQVCSSGLLLREDVIRFDHGDRIYAIYRTADNKLYASDGLCTHGAGMLCDGLVSGNTIECPKHNGRFDVRDGSPQRAPVREPIKTYKVREEHGKIFFKVTTDQGQPGPR